MFARFWKVHLGMLVYAVSAAVLGACAFMDEEPPPLEGTAALIQRLKDPDLGVMVVAHRGCWTEAPENSLGAIEACMRLGVDIVELDVRETLDGYLVLLHDETVDRTTTGHGSVANMNYTELRRLFLREGDGDFDAAATRYRVPTLAEAFQIARGRILINIDDKVGAYHKVVGLAEKMRVTDHIILKREIPFSRDDYRSMAISDHVHFMPKITQGSVALSEAALEYDWASPVAFEIKFREEGYLMEGADAIGRMNARIWASTLSSSPEKSAGHIDALAMRNPHEHWGRLVTLGVSMIQTDEPGPLIRFLESRGLRPTVAAR